MLKDLGGLMKQAQEMQSKMQAMQEELEAREVEGVRKALMVHKNNFS